MSTSALLLQVLLAWALISMLLIMALIVALISLARQLPRRQGWFWRLYYQVRWYGIPILQRRQRRSSYHYAQLNERETRAELAALALAEYERSRQQQQEEVSE